MSLITQIKKRLTGLSFSQEYLCISLEDLASPLGVFLTFPGGNHDVTQTHLFLGYKPLIIGLIYPDQKNVTASLEMPEEISLHFTNGNFEGNCKWQGFEADKTSIARLRLRRKETRRLGSKIIYFYEGIDGVHFFIRWQQQWINNLREKVRFRKAGNVTLPGNLYQQIRIAYSVPRVISIITISDGDKINMFPTDLHGLVSDKYYVGSLRIGGRVNDQVEQWKKITISTVDAARYGETYALGKNHMTELRGKENFSCHDMLSENFQHALPVGTNHYRELMWKDSMDLGIHRIHFYEIICSRAVSDSGSTLAHIHHYYGQWREDHGLKANYLLR